MEEAENEESARDCSNERKDRQKYYEKNRDRRDLTYNFFQLMKDHNQLIQSTLVNDQKLNFNEIEKDLWKKFTNYEAPDTKKSLLFDNQQQGQQNIFQSLANRKQDVTEESKFLKKIQSLPCLVNRQHLTQDALNSVQKYALEDPERSKELHRRLERAIVKKDNPHAI